MKQFSLFLFSLFLSLLLHAQTDTISDNLYQNNGRMGIGVSNPAHLLDIQSYEDGYGTNPRQFIYLHNKANSFKSNVAISLHSGVDDNETATSFGLAGQDYTAIEGLGGFAYIFNVNSGIALRAKNENGVIRLLTGGDSLSNERMRVSADGNVGIGTIDPQAKLDVAGGIKLGNSQVDVPGLMRWNGNDFEGYDGSSWKSLVRNNDPFQTENVYFENRRLGIGYASPEYLLDIRSNEDGYGANPRQFIYLHNTANSFKTNVALSMHSGSGENEVAASFGLAGNNYSAIEGLGGFAYIFNVNSGIALRANNEEGVIRMITGGDELENERLRISANGNVGIGTTQPSAKLEIADGDIFINDISSGIIMKSPDGECWRGTMSNTGQLNFSHIDCSQVNNAYQHTGIIDDELTEMQVYPNPSDNIINIVIDQSKLGESYSYKILTVSGSIVQQGNLAQNSAVINIGNLSAGQYFIGIYNSNGQKVCTREFSKL